MTFNLVDENVLADRSDLPFAERRETKVIGLRELFGLLRRRFLLVASIVGTVTLACVVVAYELPKTYTARSMILLRPDDPNLLDDAATSPTQQPSKPTMDTETDLITSRAFARQIVDKLDLVNNPKFNTYLPQPADEEASARRWALPALSDLGRFFGMAEEARSELPSAATQVDKAISVLLSRITVTRNGESMAMTVSAYDADPAMAASIANAMTKYFVDWSRDLKREDIRSGVEFLRQQSLELASHIARTEQQIADFGRQNDVSSDPRDDLLRDAMQRTNEQLSVARGDLAQAESRLAQIRKEAAGSATDSDPLLASEFLTTLRNEEAAAFRDKAQLTRNFGSNHPLLQAADAKVESVQVAIAQEMKRIIANLENDVRVARDRASKAEADVAKSDLELRNRSPAEIKLRELNRDLLTEQKLYDIVASRLGKLDPYASIADPGARVVSVAETPIEPSFPKPRVLIAGGFVGSLVLAFVLAMTIESLDSRIRNGKMLASILRAPVFALVPRLRTRIPGLSADIVAYLQNRPHSAFAESFRALYSACRRSVVGQRSRVVMITSALPSEGRTTVAIGLAHTAALDGARTVLVDLDRHAGNVYKRMKLASDAKPLSDYVEGRCSFQEILHAVPGMPDFDVLTSRVEDGMPAARHGFRQLETLIGMLRDEYDFVVVDAPPLLMVGDAAVIAASVDGVVPVAACGRTTEEALREARERLGSAKASIIGAVLNAVDAKSPDGRAYRVSRMSWKRHTTYFAN